MKKIKVPAIYLMLALLLLISCKKNLPDAGGNRLHKIIGTTGDSSGVTVFHYNLSGQLTTISETINKIPVSEMHYTYDTDGNLKESQRKDLLSGTTWTDVFFREGNGSIKKVSTGHTGLVVHTVYTFNAQGKPVSDTNYDQQMLPFAYTSFQYDLRGNLSRWQRFLKIAPAINWMSVGESTAVHNSNPNPYHAFGLVYYLSGNNPQGLSNFLTQQLKTPSAETHKYRYAYFSNGLPSHMFIDSGFPPNVSVRLYYH